MKNKSKTIVRIISLILIALIFGVSIYTVNAARIAGNAVPMPFGVGAAVVLSGSMEPELSVGDLLILAEKDEYFVGDIVAFQDGRMAVTHRIAAFTEDGVITRGDANNVNDDPILPEQIKGKVVFVIPLVGYVVNVIKTPLGTLAILAIAVFLSEYSFRSDKKKHETELDSIKAEINRLKEEQNRGARK